jgi:hypothetical protein
MVQQSKFNNHYSPLGIDGFFEGQLESTDGLVAISVNCLCDQPYQVIIRQYRSNDRTTIMQENSENVAPDVKHIVQTPIKAQFYNVVVLNQSGGVAMLLTQITTILNSTHFINLDIRKLQADGGKEDSVLCYGVDGLTGIRHPLNVDASGSLIVIGGGGGDASQWATFPAVDNVDMDGFALQKVTGINSTALDNLSISTAGGDILLQTATDEENANVISYSSLGNLTFSNGGQNINNLLGVTNSQGFKLTEEGGGSIIFSDSTVQTTAYQNPFQVDLGMNDKSINNLNSINGVATKGLPITTDGIISLSSQASVQLQIPPAPPVGPPPYPEPAPTKVLYYDGDLLLAEGTQNITNSLGITTSNSFTLTQDGGGVITFEDGTTMTTASASPSTWSEYPATQIVDMGGFGLSNIEGDITTGQNGSLSILSNSSDPVASATLRLIINETISENTKPASEIRLEGAEVRIRTVVGGWDESTPIETTFGSDGKLSVPSIQMMSGDLDLNGKSVVRTQQIFGDNDMIFTAGLTNESSTLSLTNNGYAVAGTYSQLFLKPTGVELNTGDIPTATSHTATFDTAGVFSAPKFKVSEEVVGYGLDMNSSAIINAIGINSAPATDINIEGIDADCQVILNANTSGIGGNSTLSVAPSIIALNTLITGTTDTATAFFTAQSGTFVAPFFIAQGFQPSVGAFQKSFVETAELKSVEKIFFSDLSIQQTAYTGDDVKTITSTDGSVTITTPSANTVNLSVPTPQGITSNTFYVNDNVNNINDVIGLMGSGDIAIMSAGTFGQSSDITWNVAQSGLSGSVAPAPLSFLTTANASRFTVTATQVRIANIKYQLPVFLSGNNCVVDNCDFDSAVTIGTNVTGFITINNCEFGNTPVITVASTFTNVLYFINCNFASSTFSLLNPSASQVIFNNCAGFTSYPTNATYVGINVLSAGSSQLSTNDLKSVVTGGTLRLTSGLNVNSQAFTNVGTMSPVTNGQISFTNGLNIPSGSLNMRFNNILNAGTISWTTGLTTIASASATRNLYTVSIPAFVSGANANYVMNDLGEFSTKSVTLTTGGEITYPDTTTQNSGLVKGSGTLVAGSLTITDARVTTGAICVATYAHAPTQKECLGAIVTAGQIVIQSSLANDVSPVFYLYFI